MGDREGVAPAELGDLLADLGEAQELYSVRLTRNGNVLTQTQVGVPHWTVPQDVWSSAMAGGGFAVEVAQLSDTFGPGPYARRMIDA